MVFRSCFDMGFKTAKLDIYIICSSFHISNFRERLTLYQKHKNILLPYSLCGIYVFVTIKMSSNSFCTGKTPLFFQFSIYFSSSHDVVRKMDKSWMKLPRSSREYIRGVMAFVKFAREHESRKWVIVCPCKKCLLGKSWSCEIVFAHLTSGAGIIEGYTEWIMHGELPVPPVHNETTHEAPRTLQVDSIPLNGGSSGMQDMLTDVFAMHDVCVEVGGSQVGVDAEAESEYVDVEIEDSNRVPNKLEDLLKDADTPLHGNTKHSKLGAIVRLYSIKCMSGWSNTSFSMLLEFINELMHPYASLPKTLRVEDLDRLENQIPIILCKLERIFPPGFFTSMVHVIIHLVRECKLGGPVHYRWMYPIKR